MTTSPLFEPLRLGPVEIPNRIVLSPMTTGFGYDEGRPTEQLADYFRARCGDVGMAVVAFGAVSPEGRVERHIPWMWHDDAAKAMAPLANVIRESGTVPCLQLGHGGRQVSPKVIGRAPVAPSPIPPTVHVAVEPEPLSVNQIEAIVAAFGSAAGRAAAAGFGAIEIHAAHGYLIQQFLDATSNTRSDRYGGDRIADRARFGIEVLQAVHNAAPDLAVVVRINGSDLKSPDDDGADAAAVSAIFAAEGADAIVVSAGVYGSVPYTIPLLDDPHHTFVRYAERVKRAVEVPVFAVGRITDPVAAASIVQSGACDGVAIGRALLADPHWATKAHQGRFTEIRPCIATVEGCAGMLQHGDPISCSVNPEVGREGRAPPTRRPSRSVAVVGSGAAGLEAARRAAELGHEVTLFERRDHLGGGVALASLTPPLAHLAELVVWYEQQLAARGVIISRETDVDAESLERLGADHAIVATGSETELPLLDGYDRLPVWTAEGALSGDPATTGTRELPATVAVIGGGRRSLAIAAWLARDSEVTLVTQGRFGADTSGLARRAYRARADAGGVAVVADRVAEITGEGVSLIGGDVLIVGGVVLADPVRRVVPPWATSRSFPVSIVGDCREPRGIAAAVAEGRDAAERI